MSGIQSQSCHLSDLSKLFKSLSLISSSQKWDEVYLSKLAVRMKSIIKVQHCIKYASCFGVL